MPDLIRVYHPVTEEPFDLPVGRANDLILNKGWFRQKSDESAEPYVTTAANEVPVIDDWRICEKHLFGVDGDYEDEQDADSESE